MRALKYNKPKFEKDFIEQAIIDGKGMRDIMSELKTNELAIEERIEELFGVNASFKLEHLHKNDIENAKRSGELNSIPKHVQVTSFKTNNLNASSTEILNAMLGDGSSMTKSTARKIKNEAIRHLKKNLKELLESSINEQLEDNFSDSLEETLRTLMPDDAEFADAQMAADDSSGEEFTEIDTSVTRSEIKRLEKEISESFKELSSCRERFRNAEVAKTEADKKVERAEDKLRRAKQEASSAKGDLDSAKSSVECAERRYEDLKQRCAAMQKELDSLTLPVFKVISCGDDFISLKAINYSLSANENMSDSIEWARRIGNYPHDLSNSEYTNLARLFGVLTKLKGKYKVEIDPSLTRVLDVYDKFKNGFYG